MIKFWDITIFNPDMHMVGALQAAPLDRAYIQGIADKLRDGFCLYVYIGVHTVGNSSSLSRRIVWD